MKKGVFFCIWVLLLVSASPLRSEEFSQEAALEHVRYLAEAIGPRPMGSPQEQAALDYVAAILEEYGCDVDRHRITRSDNQITASGNVFGRLTGLSSREIVIGAHIDSATPEIPGANDDGSGVAVVLELARIFSQTPHHATLVFVAFGGEEAGLVGSKYFVEHYPLENVAMMLQLDMTSNDSPLLMWIDTRTHQCPEWLVSASIDLFHELGYEGIDYPTNFQSLNLALPGAGSDHEPFLRKGVPAIAFVSDLRHPIHTRNDNLAYFEPAGLVRSGRLVKELVRRFDKEQPEVNSGHYMLFLVGERPLYIPPFLLRALVYATVVLSLFTLYRVRADRIDPGYKEDRKIRLSWPKLAVMLVVILITLTVADWMLRLIKGQRLYWYAFPRTHLLYVFPVSLLGIWIALQLLNRWELRQDVFFYLIRAAVIFWILIIGAMSYVGPRMAFYPSVALLLICLACLAPWGWLKSLLWLLSPYLMFRLLILPEYFDFIFRGVAHLYSQIHGPVQELLVSGVFILYMFVWAMPFLLGFAAVRRSFKGDLFWIKHFRGQLLGVFLAGLAVAGAIYLYTLPSYTGTWEQPVTVSQRSEQDRTYIQYESFDYLKSIVSNTDWKFETIDVRSNTYEQDYPLELDWIEENTSVRTEDLENETRVDLEISLKFRKQPYTVVLSLEGTETVKIEESDVFYTQDEKSGRIRLEWFCYPPLSLNPHFKLRIPAGSELKGELRATFLEMPVEIVCSGGDKEYIFRSEIVRSLELKAFSREGKDGGE